MFSTRAGKNLDFLSKTNQSFVTRPTTCTRSHRNTTATNFKTAGDKFMETNIYSDFEKISSSKLNRRGIESYGGKSVESNGEFDPSHTHNFSLSVVRQKKDLIENGLNEMKNFN